MKYMKNVATLRYDSSKCTGCGRCTEVCPRGVFIMKEKRAAITDGDLCIECGACALNCSFNAINVEAGVGCAQAVLNSMIYGGEPNCDCSGEGSSCC